MNPMAKRVYDHTRAAHIRERLKNQALYAVTGLVVPLLGYGFIKLLIGGIQVSDNDTPATLEAVTRGALVIAAGTSLLILIITLIQWLNYRYNRPSPARITRKR